MDLFFNERYWKKRLEDKLISRTIKFREESIMSESSQNKHSKQDSKNCRRRRKFIRKDLQVRVVLSTLFVSLLILVFNYQAPLFGIWYLKESSDIYDPDTIAAFSNILLISFGISAVLTIPLALWIGVIQSFSFSGPIYKFKKHFTELVSGRWDTPCTLRKGDDLKDVCEVFNEYTALVCTQLEDQRKLLEDLKSQVNRAHSDSETEDLLLRIEEASRKIDFRLGELEVESSVPDQEEVVSVS